MPMPLFCSIRTCISHLICLFTLCCLPALALWAPPSSSRAQSATMAVDARLRNLFADRGLAYPPQHLFFRIFKSESVLEVWAADQAAQAMTLVKTYPVCAMSGELGPKRKQGDFQVPEGFYYIDHYNPYSTYYLSLRINYPNASDRALSRHSHLGGDIYIHGDCVSEGCMAMTDSNIKELYSLATQAHARGQSRIPVHIFPARLSEFKLNILRRLYAEEPEMVRFWTNLQAGYTHFQQSAQVPSINIGAAGQYELNKQK